MIEGILFLNGVLTRTSWAISGYCGGSNNSRGVYNRPGMCARCGSWAFLLGFAMVGLSKTFLHFHCFSGSRSGSRPFCAPCTGGQAYSSCTSAASSNHVKVGY